MSARQYSAARHLLSLENHLTSLNQFTGGNVRGEVETLDRGPQHVALKHIATIRYEPFTFAVGLSMGAPLAAWVKGALALAQDRKTGSVIVTDEEGHAQRYFHFRDALIEEITIPAVDASSSAPAFLTIRCQPEEVTYGAADDASLKGALEVRPVRWLGANFRLRLGALPCERVSRIEPFTIRQHIMESTVNQPGVGSTKEPVGLQFPNIKVMFSAADIEPWQRWFSEFVIRGQNDQDKELQGTLEFLDATMKETLASVEFFQVGIFSLTPEKAETDRDAPARFVAELYVESMAINLLKT